MYNQIKIKKRKIFKKYLRIKKREKDEQMIKQTVQMIDLDLFDC